MKVFITTIFLIFSTALIAQQKQVCITFDDLPVVNYGVKDSTYQKELFNNLMLSLNTHNVPAIGFVNEKKLYNKNGIIPFQVNLLKAWSESGLELGNHTFSHPDYNKVSFQYFADDVIKGETITKKILGEQGKQIKYFRHPFLHVGNTKAKADSLTEFLSTHNYIVAPITIDNEDYYFAVAYKRAVDRNDTALQNKIGSDYIAYMEKKIKYFENQSQKLFGRNIPQIMLLHASLLNSDYSDSLISLFKDNGYEFISMDDALKDSVYKTEVTFFGDMGISWLDTWALSAGKKGDFFKEDPKIPDYIIELVSKK